MGGGGGAGGEKRERLKTIISVDPALPPWEQSPPVHNRWHPDIPPVATVVEGEVFRVETIDWTGGQSEATTTPRGGGANRD